MKRKQRSKPETVTVGNVMVRIYKRTRQTAIGKSRTVYEVSDYTNGRRRLRSFTDHGVARNEADRIARQIATGDATAATMLNSEAASYGRAVELLQPTGISLEVAAATVAKAVQILGDDYIIEACQDYARRRTDKIQQRPIADVILELIQLRAQRTKTGKPASAAYLSDLRQRLARFAKRFGADTSVIFEPDKKDETGTDRRNRGVDISSITTAEVQSWLDSLKLSPQSTKNFRTVLNTLFEFGATRGYVFKHGNPVAGTEGISASGGEIEIFTPEEIGKLLKHAPPEFFPFVAIGAFAGLRTEEIKRLEWSNVDLSGGFIHIGKEKAKTKSRRLVPIQPNLSAWLAPYAKHSGLVWKSTANALQKARAACVKAAGVAWKDNGLRHSYASYRLADIQNAAQVALEMGNSPKVVFAHYRELVKPSAAKAWFAVAPEAAANVIQLKSATK